MIIVEIIGTRPTRIININRCCIFWPAFVCCTLWMLVEIFVFNLFFAKKLKNAKMQKSMKFAAKFSKNMSFFKFAPKSWSKGRAFVVSSTQNHRIIHLFYLWNTGLIMKKSIVSDTFQKCQHHWQLDLYFAALLPCVPSQEMVKLVYLHSVFRVKSNF